MPLVRGAIAIVQFAAVQLTDSTTSLFS